MPSLPSRGKYLVIALENVHKSVIKLSMESLILLDFVNLCQMFREGFFVFHTRSLISLTRQCSSFVFDWPDLYVA